MNSVQTTHEWIRKLARKSDLIAQMQLEATVPYKGLDKDAYVLANCDAHSRLIAHAIDKLIADSALSKENARKLLGELIVRQTYGTFAELAAYDWLIRCGLKFVAQVNMSPTEVLATSGSTLGGRIEFPSLYFDVKAFGSNGRLAQRLKEKLQAIFPIEDVLVEESWDLSFDVFAKLLHTAPDIASELRQKRFIREGPMTIRLQEKRPVTVSWRGSDPYLLAREYALFPFSDAKQFTRNHPFILILVVHPWFNSLVIHNDFAGQDTIFTRSLARRVFLQFETDTRPLGLTAGAKHVPESVTLADASRLLSAIFFVNVWPRDADPSITYKFPSWLYVNPRATHRISPHSLALFRSEDPHGTSIDDFSNDDY